MARVLIPEKREGFCRARRISGISSTWRGEKGSGKIPAHQFAHLSDSKFCKEMLEWVWHNG